MDEVCKALSDSFVGELLLYAMAALAGSGTLAQVDRFIPERLKNRRGTIRKVLWAIWDQGGGNAGNSVNRDTGAAADSPV